MPKYLDSRQLSVLGLQGLAQLLCKAVGLLGLLGGVCTCLGLLTHPPLLRQGLLEAAHCLLQVCSNKGQAQGLGLHRACKQHKRDREKRDIREQDRSQRKQTRLNVIKHTPARSNIVIGSSLTKETSCLTAQCCTKTGLLFYTCTEQTSMNAADYWHSYLGIEEGVGE